MEGAGGPDRYRFLDALEHGCMNLIKCAVPLIFSQRGSHVPAAVPAGRTPAEQLEFCLLGGRVVDMVLAGSEDCIAAMDRHIGHSATSQGSVSEDAGGADHGDAYRFGTVLSGILPTVLMYGIALARSDGPVFAIMPRVLRLIQRLQSGPMRRGVFGRGLGRGDDDDDKDDDDDSLLGTEDAHRLTLLSGAGTGTGTGASVSVSAGTASVDILSLTAGGSYR
jgi:hypothetical protein